MLLPTIVTTAVAVVASAAPAADAIGEHRVPTTARSVDYFSDSRP